MSYGSALLLMCAERGLNRWMLTPAEWATLLADIGTTADMRHHYASRNMRGHA